MAEKLCELRKKGGGGVTPTETTLWTNNTPTSAFSNQDITLSDDISNFTYIKIKFRFSTSDSTNTSICVESQVFNDSNNAVCLRSTASGMSWIRISTMTDDTTIRFTTSYRVNNSGTNNSYSIPTEIIGIK